MDPLALENAAVCSSLRRELEHQKWLLANTNDLNSIRASQIKIQAYCSRLGEIERLQTRAA